MQAPEIIITEDGSHSLKLRDVDEHYHSVYGAIAESRHVFIEAGLKIVLKASPSQLNILEVGFGTGLNALLTLFAIRHTDVVIRYTALEPFPLDEKIWQALNYPEFLDANEAAESFSGLHNSPWEQMHEITTGFYIQKTRKGILDLSPAAPVFNLVYFDAFSPDVQPELWTEEIFELISKITRPDAVLVTYSARGSVRRAMQKAGFAVERLPGPKGKREMLRAIRL